MAHTLGLGQSTAPIPRTLVSRKKPTYLLAGDNPCFSTRGPFHVISTSTQVRSNSYCPRSAQDASVLKVMQMPCPVTRLDAAAGHLNHLKLHVVAAPFHDGRCRSRLDAHHLIHLFSVQRQLSLSPCTTG